MFNTEVALALGSIAGVVLTILLYIKVLPRKNDGTFDKPIVQFLHDFFHFKKLYLEEVLKFVYVLATVATVCVGAFLLLGYQESWSYYGGSSKESTFLYGLAMIVGGPISLRLGYEVVMMFILLVKNTIDINTKLPAKDEQTAPVAQEIPSAPAEPVVTTCPNCGAVLGSDNVFCTNCGHRR